MAAVNDPAVSAKVTIKYQFMNYNNLDAHSLFTTINQELSRYDQAHHGIISLYGKTSSNPAQQYQIMARFDKVSANDPTVRFVNKNNNSVDSDPAARTGYVDTTNITTTLDLTAWIQTLLTTPTVAQTSAPGQITTLIPPVLSEHPPAHLFANHAFSTIETWLTAAGIKPW